MDPLAHLLDGPRARGACTLRAVMGSPWAIDVRDNAALSLVVVTSGRAHVSGPHGEADLATGDLLLIRGPDPYVVSDGGGHTPDITILPGQRCVSGDGREVHLTMSHGVGIWGNDPDGEDTMIVGTYEDDSEVGRLALAALPTMAVLPGGRVDPVLVDLLSREIASGRPAQASLNDRLLDSLLVMAVRAWIEDHPRAAPNWLTAQSDPVVARALEEIHEHPAHPWTLEALARACAVSRATLAARFQKAMAVPPMTYLRTWRLSMACDLLVAEPALGLESVAARVGYGSAFAFSTAFRKHTGVSPSQYRARSAAVPARVG
ncbi:AraC family transcriptional regulator [Nocardiopsis sp. LOL_012]|uniref:AraC family transcriptional regulator n=1 Tax=Nocardiopsis sp. LOL_012 TaxID=3345409 RepID=UPI003A88E770